MTSVRDQIRLLEAKHANDALSDEEFERRKSEIFDAIPEVREIAPTQIPDDTGALSWLLASIGMVGVMAVLTFLIGDLTIAATLVATLIAAVAVRAYCKLDS